MNNRKPNTICSVTSQEAFRWLSAGPLLCVVLLLTGCGIPWHTWSHSENDTGSDHFDRRRALVAQGKYEAAFQENEKALAAGKVAPDIALFNMGAISAHSLNPKRDYPRALFSFKRLIKEHPQSPLAEQSKAWVEVLEERQRLTEERSTLAEEKRVLAREKEVLLLEREKLRYTADKARQVDIDIERRRRKTLAR